MNQEAPLIQDLPTEPADSPNALFASLEEFILMADIQIREGLPLVSLERTVRNLANRALDLVQLFLLAELRQNALPPDWVTKAEALVKEAKLLRTLVYQKLEEHGYDKFIELYFPEKGQNSDILHIKIAIEFINSLRRQYPEEKRQVLERQIRKIERFIRNLKRWRRKLYEIIEIRHWCLEQVKKLYP